MRRREKTQIMIIVAAVAILAAAAIVLIIALAKKGNNTDSASQVEAGIAYVKEAETEDVDAVKAILQEQKKQALQEQVSEKMKIVEEDNSKVWSLFEDYLLMGDSRAEGFVDYGYLLADNCLVERGIGLRDHLELHLQDIYDRDPENLILCYGINDVTLTDSDYWPTAEDYCAEFKETLETIHENVPNTRIYISSILIARGAALEQDSRYENIPEYNEALKNMCESLDYCWYIDNSDISEEYADLWDQDGYHVKPSFYPYWGINMIKTIYTSILEDTEVSTD